MRKSLYSSIILGSLEVDDEKVSMLIGVVFVLSFLCCHSTSAVNKDNALDCKAVLCTMDCAPNTLDCGQGQIKCVDNICTVRLNE